MVNYVFVFNGAGYLGFRFIWCWNKYISFFIRLKTCVTSAISYFNRECLGEISPHLVENSPEFFLLFTF